MRLIGRLYDSDGDNYGLALIRVMYGSSKAQSVLLFSGLLAAHQAVSSQNIWRSKRVTGIKLYKCWSAYKYETFDCLNASNQ